jgi:hypothetical protein
MARTHRGIWLLAVALSCATPVVVATATAPATFEQTLLEADRLRSSDPQRFAILLDQLDAAGQAASEGQRQRVQYLRAYQSVVHRNALEQGIVQAKAVFDQSVDADIKFRAGSLLANSYPISRNFTDALRYLNQAMLLRERVRDKDILHDGIDAAAALYNQMGQYKLGLQYAQETLGDNPNPRALCLAGLFEVESQHHLGLLPADDSSVHRYIERCNAIGEKLPANFIRVVLARKWVAQGRGDKAIELLEQHQAEVDRIGYRWLIGELRALLAELKLGKGDLANAQRHAEAAIARIESLPSSKSLATAYNVLYQIAERQQDPAAALAFYRQYAEADKAYLTDVKARDLAY